MNDSSPPRLSTDHQRVTLRGRMDRRAAEMLALELRRRLRDLGIGGATVAITVDQAAEPDHP